MEIFDLLDVKETELKALQEKNLEILEYFDAFCTEHNLQYSLLGGTLIGAIRHHGFIPWDDDVDLMMPRDDYEKLSKIWNQESINSQYVLVRSDLKSNYHDAGIGIKDTQTTFINKHSINDDVIHSIGIEIMPIDGAPKSKVKRLLQLYNAFIFALFNTQRLPDNKGKAILIVTGFIYAVVPWKKTRYNIWKRAERRMTKHRWEDSDEVTELIGSIRGMTTLHPKDDFESVVRVPFEHLSLPVIKGYDRYLTLIFGDYMALPPVQERIAKHNIAYINTEEPYHKFKNKYYCIKD
ncbi:LicD family protein [Erysipelothrix piscisicarius]|uniref:LicD family protein n=1 Tax=Erysipelothrix piscisicarius TaxID=2485784 RepID=UPI001E452703|nr:LicD family protein [Erysipelothrix piscisicarius]